MLRWVRQVVAATRSSIVGIVHLDNKVDELQNPIWERAPLLFKPPKLQAVGTYPLETIGDDFSMPAIKYRTTTWPPHERATQITENESQSKNRIPFFEFKNTKTNLSVIRIPLDLLLYRVDNYRTRTAQLRYIQENGKSATFFSTGQENESVQRIQHILLVTLTERGRHNVTSIVEILKSEGQREPLLITNGGVVVNGNRRLATMRELFARDPNQYARFSHVDCAVLPAGATVDDIRETEVRLQMRPETRLPYSWIDESIAIQDMIDSGKPVSYIATLMRKTDYQVRLASSALREVDIYLEESLQKPGHYHEVEDSEQLFKDLAKALRPKDGIETDVSRRIAWILNDNSDNLGRRVYDYNFSFGKQTNDVVQGLVEHLDADVIERVEQPSPTEGSGVDDPDAEFDIDIDVFEEPVSSQTPWDRALATLEDTDQSIDEQQHITDAVISVVTSIYEHNQEGRRQNEARTTLRRIEKSLRKISFASAHPSTYSAIGQLIRSIRQRTNTLKNELERLQATAHD